MQYRKHEDAVVTSSKTLWSAKVSLVRWIRSKVQFEFPTNVWAVEKGLLEEEGVFWWDR
ncbi:hypothetical protein M407DRAFT_246492 [Tulasnella calospora MUT 4182]|uniref:Uncharacterized protein n=1 Tax=Tulasnella calospora MUT 4182 TaxID=1051891 RepID=A0A0C3LAD6_9AGAM|nr:hypothetical protein M407DRAFT_246492 [Tulasnella calospora MUT 4182]